MSFYGLKIPSLFNFLKATDSKIEDETQWGVCIWKESSTEKAGGAGRKENKEEAKTSETLGQRFLSY